jgi:hypothetical protein
MDALLTFLVCDGDHAYMGLAGVEYSSGKTQHESGPPQPQAFFFEEYPIIDR